MSGPEKKTAAQLREELAAIAAKREARRADLEVEALELELRLEGEIGPKGKMFDVVDVSDLLESPIGIRLGDSVLHKRFTTSKMTQEDAEAYVAPCVVHPSKEKFLELAQMHPAVVDRCAGALAALFGLKIRDNAGKA